MNNNTGLARPLTGLASYYPAVVVGAGCGGAVAASRLARIGQRVCVLARGRAQPAEPVPRDLVRSELADARAHGVELFIHVEVRAILPAHRGAPGRWRIAIQLMEQGRDAFDAPELFLHADEVILAAGASGTGEILLRSRARGLPLSPRLGHGGACVMAADAARGVVDRDSRVFRSATGRAVHPGLSICDASLLPRAPGVAPAVAPAVAPGVAPAVAPPAEPAADPPERPSLHFTERMRGHLIEKLGGRRSAFAFVLTLVSDDLPAMFTDPDHVAHLVGTVAAPALSSEPLTAHGDCSQLLHRDPDGARRMHYRMTMHSVEGHVYCLDGIKQIQAPPDLWSDTTDLAYTLHDGPDPHGRVLGQGHLSLALPDLARQLTTMDVTGVSDPVQRRDYLTRFLRFFGQALLTTYLEPANDSEPGSSAA